MDQIVAETVSCQNQINSFFDNQRIALLLKQSNIVKQCGITPVVVMRMIFSLYSQVIRSCNLEVMGVNQSGISSECHFLRQSLKLAPRLKNVFVIFDFLQSTDQPRGKLELFNAMAQQIIRSSSHFPNFLAKPYRRVL